METKEIKITVPEGYEIDKENSTFECIKFKKIPPVGPSFKVGDRVKVKPRPYLEKFLSKPGWQTTPEMLRYAGKICTISESHPYSHSDDLGGDYMIYRLEEDSEFWSWRDFCFTTPTPGEELKDMYDRIQTKYPDWGKKFCDNLDSRILSSDTEFKLNACRNVFRDPGTGLGASFTWRFTPEGDDFWRTVARYYKYVKKE